MAHLVTEIIRKRSTVFADDYLDKAIPVEVVEEILTNATWAPNYKLTEPWRFIVLQEAYQKKFGQYLADYYRQQSPSGLSARRYDRLVNYPLKAGCLVALIMIRNEKAKISEWEEIAAFSCAVQNIWLSCTAHNIGAYWDTTAGSLEFGNQLDLKPNERCLGFFYMGYYDLEQKNFKRKRTALQQKLTWLP